MGQHGCRGDVFLLGQGDLPCASPSRPSHAALTPHLPVHPRSKIVNWATYLRFPAEAEASLSPAAKDLIMRLLCDVDRRLGGHGAAEIKRHPFFRGVDWVRLYESPPPYRPAITHELDTQNFEQYEDPERGARAGHSPGSASSRSRPVADPNFIGYTYKPFEAVQRSDSGGSPFIS